MSHFLTIVFVPRTAVAPAEAAETLLRPYFASDLGAAPAARCDGFVIGGRFDGDLWGKPQQFGLTPAEYQQRYGLDVVRVEDNIRPATELRPGLLPQAVITPDGHWRDGQGQRDASWAATWSALQRQFSDHLAVAIDCHC